MFVFGFYSSVSEFNKLKKAYDNSMYSVVEGSVINFRSDSRYESFNVGNESFSYSKNSQGYNVLCSNGGFIRNNIKIKLWYFDSKVLYIETTNSTLLKVEVQDNLYKNLSRTESRKVSKCNFYVEHKY